uniref:N-terminal E2 ubiquitin-conjugating enzyme n=1 Tax=Phallusia mammillata TaxID=59560 RepID=A0A6F9DVH5_9ASCI|nr:ubiquitin-conjugating enzyme E2 W-like [Phallusia mammillata]
MAGCFVQKRIQKEILTLKNSPPPGMKLCDDSLSSPGQFMVEVKGAEGTLFAGEEFKLLFKFGQSYPFDSPQVTFVGNQIPVHPHVYSNGHICLSILTEDWSPALSAESVCLSIISMLSSCSEKKRPPDNAFYIRTCSKNPKNTKWWFHDDKV